MDDKKQIEIEFVYTKELFRESYRDLFDNKVKPRNFIWVGVVIVIYLIYNIYTYGFHMDDLWYYLPLLGVPLGLWFARFYLPRQWGDKTFKRFADKKFLWRITRQNILIFSEGKKATIPWSDFTKAMTGKEVITLETSKNRRTPIPVSAFKNNDLEVFKTWLTENIAG